MVSIGLPFKELSDEMDLAESDKSQHLSKEAHREFRPILFVTVL